MRDGLDAIEIGKYLRENPDFLLTMKKFWRG